MNQTSLQYGLKTRVLGQNLMFFDIIDSTNTRAKELLKTQHLPHGTVLVAERQTAGRGTGGSHWASAEPDSLCSSLVLQTPLQVQPLSFLPAVALVRVLRQRYAIDAHLKWPNDVLIGTRKLAGILCESVMQPNQQLAWVVGAGVNVNQQAFAPPLHDIAISMNMVLDRQVAIEDVFQAYMLEIERLYEARTDLIAAWRQYTKMIGKTVNATRHSATIRVQVQGISAEGYLEIEHADGHGESWMSTTDLDIDPSY